MQFKYNWKNYPRIEKLLIKLYNNTLEYLNNNGYLLEYANEFTQYIEDFLYYIIIHYYNLEKVLDNLEEIEYIGFIKSIYIKGEKEIIPNYKKIPPVINSGIRILLNPSLEGDNKLTEEERRRLYLYHGLAHSLFNFKNENTRKFSRKYSNLLTRNKRITEIIVTNGWLLFEETLAQELAERITYEVLEKKRPGIRPGLEYRDPFPVDGDRISSNLEMYRMFNQILILFGLTISKEEVMGECSPTLLTHKLLKKSINEDLTETVLSEYIEKNHELELYQLLYFMGLLVNEKYATYGFRPIKTIELEKEEIEEIFTTIYKLLNNLISIDRIDNNLNDQDIKKKIRNLVEEYKIDI